MVKKRVKMAILLIFDPLIALHVLELKKLKWFLTKECQEEKFRSNILNYFQVTGLEKFGFETIFCYKRSDTRKRKKFRSHLEDIF